MDNFNKQKMADALLKSGNFDRQTIDAALKGDKSKILEKLGEDDRKKIEGILSYKEALNKLMTSDAMRQIISKLSGKGK